ncbi:hypothetical protein [Caldimonas brevitalea]|uniref:Uncharacterized protein n=1 Tax=Caldimonas brevitalea TaxID=413882 RepID=A0A0G3BGQ0_9BURK|nr:hypothetical protein [Caldimonas brevitalea]AKJ27168.1 hypothetical protein AAW51_0477 [Caldimonas brevitalea]
MKDLQETTERICELKGSLIALDALMTAVLHALPDDARHEVLERFVVHAEVARTVLLHVPISEHTIAAFEHDIGRYLAIGHAPHD